MRTIGLASVDFLAEDIRRSRAEGRDFHPAVAFRETVKTLKRMKAYSPTTTLHD